VAGLDTGSKEAILESVICNIPPDRTITISCNEELVILSGDADAPPMPAEGVTIPRTADSTGSPAQAPSQPSSTQVAQPNGKQ